MTVYEPVGVDNEVLMVRVAEKVGEALQLGVPMQPPLKEAEAPAGSPLTERVTGWVFPLTKLTVIVLDPELPCMTVMPPEFDNEKSNG